MYDNALRIDMVSVGFLTHFSVCACVRQQDRTIEIAVRLSAQQLYHVTPVLEEIIREIAEEREKGMVNLMVDHVKEAQEHVSRA